MESQPALTSAALVTGASRGIGKAVALRLASLGMSVAVNYRSAEKEADAVVRAIERIGGQAVALQADIADAAQAISLLERAEDALGGVDVVINNAGITRDKLVVQLTLEDWDATWCTDLAGARALSRRALRSMRTRAGGCIINVSSVVGATGNAGQANYAAAKSALLGLTRELAVAGAPENVRVNAVIPGYIVTDATSHLTGPQREVWLARIPMGRYAETDEVVGLIAFLAGPEATYITGQCIGVDGGLLAAAGMGFAS
ncbi:MAG TPA: 3-oxoacyl-ACP reductase family protein [Chloroflexota bacterium]